MDHYDAIVIGSGQAGTPLSIALAEAGRKTALVESQHVGGTCINIGCTPTKTMVASARIAYLARRAADYGIRCGPVSVDMAQIRRRKQAIVDDFRTGEQRRLENARNVELIFGEARFTGPKLVEVRLNAGGTRTLTSDTIFINTGDRPARPRITGLDSVKTLDSTSIMELQELPEHLLVLGAATSVWNSARCFAALAVLSPSCSTESSSWVMRIRMLPLKFTSCSRRMALRFSSKPQRSACMPTRPGLVWIYAARLERGLSPAPIFCLPLAERRTARSSTSPPLG